ncbi:MAG: helix-turn-helix domain-containing protein [Bdellovibrionales bacterium]|nr:helix-turn-helix domain-containing protein [Bdellovibrionales bacterium]
MGSLAMHANQIHTVAGTIKLVLEHFDKVLKGDQAQKVSAAADLAFSDKLLFEKFEMWTHEHDDETFLFHVNRFFEKKYQKPLLASEQDLTVQRDQVESSIKKDVRNRQKQIFGQRITKLAIEHKLLTNDQLGKFLGVSGEQARKFKAGENKPQLVTLKEIADRFKVSVEFLIGLSEQSTDTHWK